MMMMMMMMMTTKGTIPDMYSLLTASNTYDPVNWAQSCADHVLHIERLSLATCRVQITCYTSSAYHSQHVVCHVARRDDSAAMFDTV